MKLTREEKREEFIGFAILCLGIAIFIAMLGSILWYFVVPQ